jgi:hypothetical protein
MLNERTLTAGTARAAASGMSTVGGTVARRTSLQPCVIRPRCTAGSDSRWRGISPAQWHGFSGRKNRHDLGDEHRGEGQTHPADLLDHPVAAVPGEPLRDHLPEQVNLAVVASISSSSEWIRCQ